MKVLNNKNDSNDNYVNKFDNQQFQITLSNAFDYGSGKFDFD